MRGASEGIITMCASPFVTRGPPSTAISCQAAGPAILKPALQSACDEVLGAQRRLKAVNPTVQIYRDRINRKIGVAILWAAVGVIPIPAFAQENGTVERSQVPGTAAVAPAGPITPGGPWNEFSFGAAGSFAKGCAPADPSAPGCAPSSAGNSHFVGAPPWTFVAPSDGATLTVTDAFVKGDTFQVLDVGNPIGSTSAVPTSSVSCGSDPVPCLADPTVSHGVFNLGPGAHSITIKALTSPFQTGAAYFRVDLKRDHLVCYQIKEQGQFRPREVATEDQFGTAKFIVTQPELLCVPASKTDITPAR
jgi:hypothetical protein